MKKLLGYAVAALCVAATSAAHACGYCIEDKIAASYDHALITRELDRGHEVLFLEIAGAVPADRAQWRSLIGAVEGVAGVVRGSVRTSVSPPVLSFAFNASRSSSATALARLNDRLRKQQLRLDLIRIIGQLEVAAR